MGGLFSRNQSKHQTIEKSLELLSSYSNLEEGLVATQTKTIKPKPKGLTLYQLLKVLRPYFWPDAGTDGALINRIRSSATWLLVGLSKASSLIAPFYLIAATDDVQTNHWNAAIIDISIFCSLRLASSIFKELQGLVYIKVKQQASIELLELTFQHIHSLSLSWHLNKKTGTVVKAMDRGTDAANTLVTYMFLYLIPALAECLAVVILFFVKYKQWSLGVTVFSGVFIYIIITVIITRWRQKFREATNKHDNDYHDKATDSIINFETVKYFTAEQFELDRFKESVVRYQKYNSSTQIANSSLNISQQVVLYATLFVAMILSSRAVIQGNMSIGEWVAVQSWVATIFVPLNFLGGVYNAIVQALVDVKNLSEMLSETPDMKDEPNSVDFPKPNKSIGASVEFSNVSFHYSEQPIEKGLKSVSFVVKAGTTTAIVGSTGSGKTTTSRLLFRFYDPISGSILIDNKNIKNFTQKSIRNLIGVVPQDTVLFNDTILYNIKYGRRDATMNEIIAAAEAAQIKQFIESLPDGWNTMVGERGLKLSGGEKQRVAIARCLLKDPPIVLLDEATSALDTVTEYSVQEALYTLGVNRTVIMIAHRLSTVKNANQIIVLDNGIIAEKGTHDELLQIDNGIYSKLWNMQVMSSGGSDSNFNILEMKSESKNDILKM